MSYFISFSLKEIENEFFQCRLFQIRSNCSFPLHILTTCHVMLAISFMLILTTQQNTVWYNTTQHNSIYFNIIKYNTLHYTSLHYTALHNTKLHYTTQHNTTTFSKFTRIHTCGIGRQSRIFLNWGARAKWPWPWSG